MKLRKTQGTMLVKEIEEEQIEEAKQNKEY